MSEQRFDVPVFFFLNFLAFEGNWRAAGGRCAAVAGKSHCDDFTASGRALIGRRKRSPPPSPPHPPPPPPPPPPPLPRYANRCKFLAAFPPFSPRSFFFVVVVLSFVSFSFFFLPGSLHRRSSIKKKNPQKKTAATTFFLFIFAWFSSPAIVDKRKTKKANKTKRQQQQQGKKERRFYSIHSAAVRWWRDFVFSFFERATKAQTRYDMQKKKNVPTSSSSSSSSSSSVSSSSFSNECIKRGRQSDDMQKKQKTNQETKYGCPTTKNTSGGGRYAKKDTRIMGQPPRFHFVSIRFGFLLFLFVCLFF